ncbi:MULTISPECIES: hypothetical protein [unclassified Colwellia]|uniref:hypothetical protein n=1 Tax=unclassified Colwellia TaxID=196834 RepID=UPI0015F4D7C2|nr:MULTISPECIES: hypothetical protein [unclassified Colwellia]MBA6354505.1 hypothetical protein [Colwellia sp. BRX8-3]MBA6358228.1 hypothetical protein [Colwellia sp. BRX8-6]MBA6366019.1 hypothetical protein [Colwellia sp. BRX8-5]MBA6377376.1 hypothetical protein [Colwellia sp. BRX8-2]MBA6379046.1 hypothetical protein [Colwellia sp. BRX10-7]
MSVANPLTASSNISLSIMSNASPAIKEKPLKPGLGVFTKDIVEISQLSLEQQ